MKILIYGINFAPEPIGVGRYTGEMAALLAAAGHQVKVVTALPYYPDWRVFSGYRKWAYTFERHGSVDVHRAPLWVPHFPNGRRRLLHLLSFAFTSVPLIIRAMLWKPEVVWLAAPAIVCAPGALLAARLTRSKSWIHVQDFEVDIAFSMNLMKAGGRAQRIALFIEGWLLRRFDRVSTVSRGMMDRAISKGVAAEKLLLLRNWSDLELVKPLTGSSAYRKELGIADNTVVALYSGSMGIKQAVDWLAEAAVILKDERNIVFVFCGDGPLKSVASAICGDVPSVKFIPLQPLSRLGELLGLADIHLLPQRPDAAEVLMPSKLTGMLASGRPVVAMAVPMSELSEVVSSCGMVVTPGDVQGFAKAILDLASSRDLRLSFGKTGRAFAELNLSSHAVIRSMEEEFLKMAS